MSTRPRLDFLDIKRHAPIARVAEMLQLRLKKDTGGFRCSCPVNDGNPRAIKITPDYKNKDGSSGAFFCHSCKASGDAIGLYAHVKDCDNYDAATALAQFFKVDSPATDPPAADGSMKPLDYLSTDHEVIELLGLTEDVCEALGIGFAAKGTMNGRLLIPLRLSDGTLCGYLGLATREDQSPLVKLPSDLAEKCGESSNREKSQTSKSEPDQLRKLFRVV